MYKPQRQACRNSRLRCWLSFILLLTSTPTRNGVLNVFQCGEIGATGATSSATAASAFSLASIFPRKTETQRKLPIDDTTDKKEESAGIINSNKNNELLQQMPGNFNVAISTAATVNAGTRMYPEPMDTAEYASFGTNTRKQQPEEQEYNGSNNNRISPARQQSAHLQLRDMVSSTAAALTRERVESLLDATQKTNGKEMEEEHANGDDPMHVSSEEEQQESHQQEQQPQNNHQNKMTRVRVHTYIDPASNRKWVALNTSRRKFMAFLQYNNVTLPETPLHRSIKSAISTETVSLQHPNSSTVEDKSNPQYVHNSVANTVECAIKKNWRDLWNARQLLTDRTELLAVYQSDNSKDDNGAEETKSTSPNKSKQVEESKKLPKRGGFSDLLNLYTNRLVAILKDEESDERTPPDERYGSSLIRPKNRNRMGLPITDPKLPYETDHRILIKWLEDNYGMSETLMLQARRFRTLPVPAQLELMNHFMHWFRGTFPYYYDRCDSCRVSQKDELAAQAHQAETEHHDHNSAEAIAQEGRHSAPDEEDDDDDDNATFLGYVYPSQVELKGKASRTELYRCHKCGSFTRFPRFNSAFDIIQSRRGRCGEYSLLLYRFLRALNHDARWVVDWADHVWAEVLIGDSGHSSKNSKPASEANGSGVGNGAELQSPSNSGSSSSERWVHLDPCEAAVDNNYLYESWGKKQTYIIALYAPLRYQAMQLQNKNKSFISESVASPGGFKFGNTVRNLWTRDVAKAHLVEDVTQAYTNDSWETICKRRDESPEEVEAAIETAMNDLHEMLEI